MGNGGQTYQDAQRTRAMRQHWSWPDRETVVRHAEELPDPLVRKLGQYAPLLAANGYSTAVADWEEAPDGNPREADALFTDQNAIDGKYRVDQELTPVEEGLVPEMPGWYQVPQEAEDICRHMVNPARPMRNFLLRGPAGVGKTMVAQAVAAGLHLPYIAQTCGADTEAADLLGQFVPDGGKEDWMGLMLPDLDRQAWTELRALDIYRKPQPGDVDPDAVFSTRVPGQEEPDEEVPDLAALDSREWRYAHASSHPYENPGIEDEAQRLRFYRAVLHDSALRSLWREDIENGRRPRYCPGPPGSLHFEKGPLALGLERGWVVELQEPSAIRNAGALVGLNALLDGTGETMLPNGKRLKRHPNAVVIATTNAGYQGTRSLNQSVLSRMDLVLEMGEPPVASVVDRLAAQTGYRDRVTLAAMVHVVRQIRQYCQQRSIRGGDPGYRETLSWVQSLLLLNDPILSARLTVVSTASAQMEDQEAILRDVVVPVFGGRQVPAGK